MKSIISSNIRERASSSIQICSSQIKSEKEDEDLNCPICSNLIWEPVGCATCKLHVCLKCIQGWLNKEKTTCPISGCQQFVDEKPHPYFFKHLSSLKLECVNKQKGCESNVYYEQYQKHIESECGYSETNCPISEYLDEHKTKCGYLLIKCQYCEQEIKRKDQQDHDEYVCDNFPTKCDNEQCSEIVKRIEKNKHLLKCQYKLDICSYCQAIYNQTQKHLHEQKCDERRLRCKGCKQPFKQSQLKQHIGLCDQINIKCQICLKEYPQLEFNKLHNKEECMQITILNLQNENDHLKAQNQKLIDEQKKISEKMEQIMNICFLNNSEPNDINDWELLIDQCYQNIMKIFNENQFLLHQKKKHRCEFNDVHQALQHFDFLTYTSILYKGWHKLHCSDCMKLVKKITPLIEPLLNEIKKAEVEINKSRHRKVKA